MHDATYMVRADASLGSLSATEPVQFDLDDPELAAPLGRIEAGETDAELFRTLGGSLFDRLFVRGIGEAYRGLLREARSAQGAGVRVSLCFDPGARRLYQLPWTLLYDPGRKCWLGGTNAPQGQRTPLTYVEHDGMPSFSALAPPHRLLLVAANPEIAGDPIDYAGEILAIDAALEPLLDKGAMEVKRLLPSGGRVTRDRLRDALASFRPNVLHFIGHGPVDRAAAFTTPGLYLERPDGLGDLCPVDILETWLHDAGGTVRLVVLNACNSDGVASRLAQKGLIAVGMRYRVHDQAAHAFSMEFYDALVDGRPVDEAVNRARARIMSDRQEHERDWLAPSLFLPSPTAADSSLDLPRFGGELVAHARPAISNWTGLW